MNFTQQKLIPALLTGLSIWVFNAQALAAATPNTAIASTDLPSYTNTRQTLQQSIEEAMRQNGIIGLSIALVDDQTVIWQKAS